MTAAASMAGRGSLRREPNDGGLRLAGDAPGRPPPNLPGVLKSPEGDDWYEVPINQQGRRALARIKAEPYSVGVTDDHVGAGYVKISFEQANRQGVTDLLKALGFRPLEDLFHAAMALDKSLGRNFILVAERDPGRGSTCWEIRNQLMRLESEAASIPPQETSVAPANVSTAAEIFAEKIVDTMGTPEYRNDDRAKADLMDAAERFFHDATEPGKAIHQANPVEHQWLAALVAADLLCACQKAITVRIWEDSTHLQKMIGATGIYLEEHLLPGLRELAKRKAAAAPPDDAPSDVT